MLKEILQPKSIEEAKLYLANKRASKLLGGGTDIIINLNKGNIQSDYLIDLSKVEELKQIKETKEHIIIGSMVTFDMLKRSSIIEKNCLLMYDCAAYMGSPQIRNIATLGGNIANAAPAADSIPCLMCVDGELVIESIKGKRRISLEEYFCNSEMKLKNNEIIVEIVIKKNKGYSGFYKLGKRNSLSISRINTAVYLELENNKIQVFKLCLGAVGRYPFRLHQLEEILCGKEIKYLFDIKILNTLESIVEESIKNRASMPFKKEAVKGVYKETVKIALNRGGIVYE